MGYNILFSTLANEDLYSIKKYIYNDNIEASKTVIKHIITSIEKLKENPAIGRAGRILRTRELVITKYPYIIPYQVRDNNIYILRVLHTSRAWNKKDL